MSDYDNRKKMLKNAVFWVIFAKAAPDFGSWHSTVKIIMYFSSK